METHELQKKRRTEPPEVRRLQLIMAAIDSISKRGFSDTTLKHVTETANLSHGVVNYHFDSKEALYDAALGFLAQEHYENWLKYYEAAEPKAAHRLAAIVRADFDKSICTHKRLAVWFAFWGQAKYRPNYLKIHNKYDNERYDRILHLCGELIADGGYDDLDPEKTARAVEAMSDGAWLSLMLYPKVADRREFRDVCMLSLSRFFPKHFPV
ncbi:MULTISPECIES: TetR/AcrR family transcriptional regulator [unclassified Ruegeria]|uniref:TetR/AcrR family transcriptional regulator n=1 Tax=unclassified Ruegeria TaxID=2625375 RepID=UPI001489698D|nr:MULTISPECIES: TetR/AcrR family transcriptional regulator [unclassified Ruegeria]